MPIDTSSGIPKSVYKRIANAFDIIETTIEQLPQALLTMDVEVVGRFFDGKQAQPVSP